MVTLVSYADRVFYRAALLQRISFLLSGGKNLLSFDKEDLAEDFLMANSETLSLARGAGYWLWKPYIILSALHRLKPQEILFYLDSGILLRKSVLDLEQSISREQITVWRGGERANLKHWTHPYVINTLDLSELELSQDLLMAGAIAVPNSHVNKSIISQWLDLCQNKYLLRPDTLLEEVGNSEKSYVWHRHDSTLLSVVAIRNNGNFCLKTFSEFENLFDLHRVPKPAFLFLSTRNSWLNQIRSCLKRFLPKQILRFAVRLKFNYVARRKGLTGEERRNHVQFFNQL